MQHDPNFFALITRKSPVSCPEHLFFYDLSVGNGVDSNRCQIVFVDQTKVALKSFRSQSLAIYLPEIEVVTYTCSDGLNEITTESDSYREGLYFIHVNANCKIILPQETAYLRNNHLDTTKILNREVNLSFGSYFANIMKKSDEFNITVPNTTLKDLDDQVKSIKQETDRDVN